MLTARGPDVNGKRRFEQTRRDGYHPDTISVPKWNKGKPLTMMSAGATLEGDELLSCDLSWRVHDRRMPSHNIVATLPARPSLGQNLEYFSRSRVHGNWLATYVFSS